MTKTPMKTMTGMMMMMMMIMTAAQKREELLWTTVFALQVSSVEQLQLGPIISSTFVMCVPTFSCYINTVYYYTMYIYYIGIYYILGIHYRSSDLDCLYRLPIPDMHELILKHKES